MADTIKVMIVDDMPQIVEYYKMIVEGERDMSVIGIAPSGKAAVALAQKLRPDVILMDIQMETDTAGIDATRRIKAALPDTKIIMLTAHNDGANITGSFVAGASDFLTNNTSLVEIINTIKECVSSGNAKLDVNKVIVEELVRLENEKESLLYMINLISRLSKSEMEILKLACKGKSYREIAKERFVEEVTIRSMVNKMKKKLGVDSMGETVKRLKTFNIIDKL